MIKRWFFKTKGKEIKEKDKKREKRVDKQEKRW